MTGRVPGAALMLGLTAAAVGGQTSDIARQTSHLAEPDFYFREAIDKRADPAAARQAIQTAAADYDRAWPTGRRSAAVAVNRGRAHFLAGHRPQAIRAFRDGLALYPWDRDLQHGLAVARRSVNSGDPEPLVGLRYRFSPVQLFLASAVSSLMLAAGLAARLTSRPGWATPAAVAGLVGVVAVAGVWWQIDRETAADRAAPVLVVRAETPLRAGNGTSYPPRLDAPLPAGAEVRRLHRRGGWVQVETNGAVGWLPEAAVLAGAAE